MKRSTLLFSLIFICLMATGTALGQSSFVQRGCQLHLVGTWKAAAPEGADSVFYRFGADATVTVLAGSGAGSQLREVASAAYMLDNPKSPKAILFKSAKGSAVFGEGTTSMQIAAYDDTSLTLVKDGSKPTRYVRVDPNRYYMVLAGRSGTFYDQSGPTFPMLIKMDGQNTQIDAVGIYSVGGKWAFGPVPAEAYNEFMREPRKDSDVMLRLEITPAQYERGLKIVRTWERRVREGDLLYSDLFLNNILLVRQVTESLNQCGERIKLYKLDWSLGDHISEHNSNSRAPFFYFKELRRLNESLHVRDEQFHEHAHSKQPAGQ